jgi:hypothetical protein
MPVMDDAEEEPEVQSETVQFEERMVRYDPAPQFPQSLALATIAIVAYLCHHSSANTSKIACRRSSNFPYFEQIINAVISAFIITFLRPPTDTA